MKYEKYLIIDAPTESIAHRKINALTSLSITTDTDTIEKIANLMKNEGASAKFNKALNNPLIKSFFK